MLTPNLAFVSKEITIYVGIPIVVFGVFGGIFNIIVFLSLKTFRQSSCAFFLLIMSFVNIGQLIFSLLSRIMISGFLIDWTATSSAYCKFRNYALQVCALMSYTCMCLATIDQFLATSLRPQWQQFLNIQKARFLCILFFIIWLLHSIPSLVWYNIVPSPIPGRASCMITNPVLSKYTTAFYLPVLTGLLPITITVLFGSLAYRNVRQIPYRVIPLVRRELDKQLTSMILVEFVYNVIVIVPYVVVLVAIYFIDGNFNSVYGNQPNFYFVLTTLIYFLYYAVSVIVEYVFKSIFLYL
jgi:hypothetical protein